jgi:hypothetical protein
MNQSMEREIVVLGLKRQRNGHSAINTAETIEKTVNQYDFDKDKIKVI